MLWRKSILFRTCCLHIQIVICYNKTTMNKKIILIMVLVVFGSAGVFGQTEFRFGAGGGGFFAGHFRGGAEWPYQTGTAVYNIPYMGGGAFGFFDTRFLELSMGFFMGRGTSTRDFGDRVVNIDRRITALDLGLMGKYPFIFDRNLTLFPLLSVNYRLTPFRSGTGHFVETGNFNALWFNLGGGLDFYFTERVFLRGTAAYGLRLPNSYERAVAVQQDGTTRLAHGPTIRLGIGFRFSETDGDGRPSRDSRALARRLNQGFAQRGISEARATAVGPGVRITIANLEFVPDSPDLIRMDELIEVVDLVQSVFVGRVQVDGHTALAGTAEGRQQLSVERAQVVSDLLISIGGWQPHEVIVRGFGAERPIATNDTPEGMARNRRVEITLFEDFR